LRSIDLLEKLENDLTKNNFRKVAEWSNKIGVKTIDVEIKNFDPFFNINTKEDFEEVKKMLIEN
jgi:molybdopterin-guanine dinucleotide biosynthesis protein A